MVYSIQKWITFTVFLKDIPSVGETFQPQNFEFLQNKMSAKLRNYPQVEKQNGTDH